MFLTRAHAQGWETEVLSYKEAQAIHHRRREAGKAIDNRSLLSEVRDRDCAIKETQRQKKKQNARPIETKIPETIAEANVEQQSGEWQDLNSIVPKEPEPETVIESQSPMEKPKKAIPYVRVLDYEQMKREAGLL